MACSSCGGGKSARSSTVGARQAARPVATTPVPVVAAADDPAYKLVTYNGPSGNHFISSPTRKVRHYGYGHKGMQINVHEDDIAMRPDVFVLVQVPAAPVATPAPAPVVAAPEPTPVPAPEPEPVAAVAPDPDDLTQIAGVGPARARALGDNGYTTFAQVAAADVVVLAGQISVTDEVALSIIESAAALI